MDDREYIKNIKKIDNVEDILQVILDNIYEIGDPYYRNINDAIIDTAKEILNKSKNNG
jgi:hypothetical protein